MAIKISKEEYQKKFGQAPVLGEANKQNKPTQSYGSKVSDAFKSGINQIKEGASQINSPSGNPLTDIEGGLKIGAGAISSAFSPLAPAFEPVGNAINAVGEKIGENSAVQNFAMSQAGENVARGAEDVANLTTIAGTIAGGPKVAKVAKNTVNAVGQGATPAVNTLGRALKSTGEGAYGLTVIPEEGTSQALRSYKAKYPDVMSRVKARMSGNEIEGKPITEANTAARHGLMGTESELGIQATRIADDLWTNKIAPKLDAVKGKVNMKSFFGEIEKEIGKTKELTQRNALKEGLNALKSEYGNVSHVSLRKLQDYKEGWAKFLPDSVYKGKPIANSIKAVKDLAAKKARDVIYKHAGPDIQEAYLDYGNLKSIMKAADKSVRDPAKRGLTTNAWQFIMDKAITPVVTTAGRVLYKTGEGLEFVGKPGAKKVGDIIK